MSESRLILVDGSGYIFRAYYALPPMNNSKGIPTNAVYGFCNMMLRLIDEHPHDKILIILDAGKNTFRNTLYSEYKANRSEAPEDLIPQFGIIREAIDAFGLDVIEKKDFEADDIIASYVRYGEENKIPTTVFSSDKDLFQLLSTNTRIMDPMKNVEIDEAKVMDKFGVGPDKITDVQALIGDSVDNIPGVPGIGPKTAAKLINEFGTFEELLGHQPSGFRTRVDGAIFQGYKVTPYYDSMVCKLICHGRNRTEAIQRMNRSLDEFVIEGITTTIDLHKTLLNHEKFINSDFNVSWLDKEKLI